MKVRTDSVCTSSGVGYFCEQCNEYCAVAIYANLNYLLSYLLTYLIRSSYTFTVSRLFFHFDHFTAGRTPWTSDQLVSRHLPKHRTTQTQNKHVHIPNIQALCRIETHDPGFQAKTIYAVDYSATVTGEFEILRYKKY
jgi:hypothetical protein